MQYLKADLSYSSICYGAFLADGGTYFLREGVVLTTSPSKNCTNAAKNAREFGDIS